jgi:DNA polymerase III subunit beta
MEFKCVKSDLHNAIQIAEKAVAVRSTLPIIGNILLEASGKGLKLSSNDLELGIEMLIDANIVQEGAILAPAKTLSSIISKLSDGEVTFKVDKNKTITIISNRSKFNIHGLPTDDFPMVHRLEKGVTIQLSAESLKEMIRQTIIAVSMDEVKQFLNGVLVEKEKNELRFVATDGFRLAKKTIVLQGSSSESISVIIPSRALQEVSKILQQIDYQGEVTIVISREQVAFEIGNIYFISRLIQGQFPDYKQVIPKETKTKVILARKDLQESAERASIIASASANIIKLEMVDDKLLITANTSSVGNVSELVDMKKEGEIVQPIAFNVRLILDVIKNIDEDNIIISLNSPLSPGVITPKENRDYTYVLMPIRTAENK